ncbi:MAG: hypothetical protein J1F35_04225 [Erysipelotrichales bacterium]|nr:hypothetical protein [Erysipelotrichales bacterium]
MSLDDIKDSIVSAGKYVSQNASIATSKANIKLNLKSKEDVLTKEYAKLGKDYFDKLTKKEKANYNNILELESEVKKLRDELDTLNDSRVCQKCGTKFSKDIKECPECGNKVNK